ncbi:MAG: metallophosphoesterase family protein [bacterium]|nr:metallophosphoesterase family protein [bacterium]
MRRIAHISDLHFGAADELVAERLIECVTSLHPHLVIVSGDLTQRARTTQFQAAKAFLDALPQPQLVIPGNHDVPMYNVYDRFIDPLGKYERIITGDLEPFVSDDEMAVAGINTARSLTIKGGRIGREEVRRLTDKMAEFPDKMLKIVVTHHPFDVPEGEDEDDIVGRARESLAIIAESGADVFLSGHLHKSHIGHSARRYKLDNGYSALIIQAGTAISHRGRGEENSFNMIEFKHPFLTVHRYTCPIPSEPFRLAATERFAHNGRGWSRM